MDAQKQIDQLQGWINELIEKVEDLQNRDSASYEYVDKKYSEINRRLVNLEDDLRQVRYTAEDAERTARNAEREAKNAKRGY